MTEQHQTPAPFLTDKFDTALAYASRTHRLQTRKASGIPYISHLLAVAAIALENGADEDQAIAALLHDAAEDQGGVARLADIRAHFGADVAAMVDDCTDAYEEPKPDWRPRKEAYIASLAAKPLRSLEVSLADKTHNASAINADLRAHGAAVWPPSSGARTAACGITARWQMLSQCWCPGWPPSVSPARWRKWKSSPCASERRQPEANRCPMACPIRTGSPAFSPASHSIRPGSNKSTTVEPR